ncbi:choline/carnitine O-acyltransferase [Streptomyces sp. NA02950]|uniref:choline/carnitine O-acyltransferase n=1 Tax=Streptomyces sp. NA02950 TaxID=2742137 RepID=UPI00158FE01F|nr:choline/carnitine O-acyltransferase [Streptomyces sp. NA02950]QKV90700.1 choline/carnitine O-acyltransferase [Streptomyces sp. NA02950]
MNKAKPPLPLPSLEASCRQYLRAVRPLQTDEQHRRTSTLVEKLLTGDGPALHEALAAWGRTTGSGWLEPLWVETYLEDRRPLPACQSAVLVPTQILRPTGVGYARWVAAVALAAVEYTLREGEDDHGDPALLRATRIPGLKRDTIADHPASDYFVVLRAGRMHRVRARWGSRGPHELEEIMKEILRLPPATHTPIAALTAARRTEWAVWRDVLVDSGPHNAHVLQTVETAMFVLCLDDAEGQSVAEAAHRFMVGNPASRWHDKAAQIMLDLDGRIGFSFEHSRGDMASFQALTAHVREKSPEIAVAPQGGRSDVRREELCWDDVGPVLERAASKAQQFALAQESRLTTVAARVENAGTETCGLLADAVVHVAAQLAHVGLRGRPAWAYQPVDMSRYAGGRIEVMRPVSPEMLEFIRLEGENASAEDRRAALIRTATEHRRRQTECITGSASERHLFALKTFGEHIFGDHAEMFDDVAWERLHSRLELSTTSVPRMGVVPFSPGSVDGYGLAYDIGSTGIFCTVITQESSASDYLVTLANEINRVAALLHNRR